MKKVLVLGSKEYPMGTNSGDDPIPSGGMETYVDDIAKELSKHIGLVIVTRRFRGTKSYERTGEIEIYRVPWIRGRYFRTPSFNFFAFLLSTYLLARRRSNLIYSHGIFASFFGYLLAKLFRKPIVCRSAGIGFHQWPFPFNKILYAMEKYVYSHCNEVIFHSKGELRNFNKKFRVEFKNAKVILTGFPIDKFITKDKSLKNELGISNKIVVTFIGRFAPVKGIKYLIKAVKILEKDIRLLLVGEGPQKEELKKLTKELNLQEKILFLEFRRDIPRILAITDIFVVSSLSEGLPTSLLEAMAAKKACVVTDIGLPVKHRENALVVQPKNSEKLGEAVNLLLRDRKLREKLGRNARKFVEENCTVEKAVEKHLKVFNSMIC